MFIKKLARFIIILELYKINYLTYVINTGKNKLNTDLKKCSF